MRTTWGKIGAWFGAMIIIASVARYLIIFDDWFRGLSGAAIGVLICCVSYLYDCKVQQSNTIIAMEDYLSDKEWKLKKQ